MTALNIASFAAAIASLVLATVAIVLSIVFYKMSSQLSESAKEAAKDIGASVEKLEKLFDRLYADTFSMMRETVSDMRKHAWGEPTSETPNILEEAEKKAAEKIEALRKRMEKQVSQIFEGQKMTDVQVGQIRGELSQLVDKAIDDSRSVEHKAREETIRRYILRHLRTLRQRKAMITAKDIVESVRDEFPAHAVIKELKRMKGDRLVEWDDELGPNTEITLMRN